MTISNRTRILISVILSTVIMASWVLSAQYPALGAGLAGNNGGHNPGIGAFSDSTPADSGDPQVMLILMIANGLIAVSYASIPVSLVVFITKRKDIPFSWVFVLFSAFILACGSTHALHVVGIWQQTSMNWLQATADSLTALISVFSAIIVWPLLPQLMAIPSPSQLQAVNQALQHEKNNLEQAQAELRRAYAEVEQRVAERTVELVRANQTLQSEIAERQQAQMALSESENRYHSLFNSMTEGFALHELVLDAQGQPCDYRFLDANPSFEHLTGLKRAELIGQLQSVVLPGEDPFWLQTYSRVVLSGESIHLENYSRVIQKYYAVIAYRPAPNQFAVMVMDITARKQAEEDREHLLTELERKNRDLEAMVYIASHDLRSPLVNIQGFGASLRKYFGQIEQMASQMTTIEELRAGMQPILSERIPKALRFIETGSTKMDTLINGLLRLSRVGRTPIQAEALDMNRLIQVILDSSAFQIEKIAAKIEMQQTLDNCHGDRQQLNQVFSNLIDNAIKYSDPSRPLVLRISSRIEGQNVLYTIADNGQGIAPENIDKIWELFRRIEADEAVPGEGLGLTIARQIVERHNGKIWAESEVNVGSRFYIKLPA